MTNKEILQDALNILEPIPADKWGRGMYYSPKTDCFCGLGHYAYVKGSPKPYFNISALIVDSDGNIIPENKQMPVVSLPLRNASKEALKILYPNISRFADIDISVINNFLFNKYNEPETKDRVIHFLKDAVAIEQDF